MDAPADDDQFHVAPGDHHQGLGRGKSAIADRDKIVQGARAQRTFASGKPQNACSAPSDLLVELFGRNPDTRMSEMDFVEQISLRGKRGIIPQSDLSKATERFAAVRSSKQEDIRARAPDQGRARRPYQMHSTRIKTEAMDEHRPAIEPACPLQLKYFAGASFVNAFAEMNYEWMLFRRAIVFGSDIFSER